MRKTTAAELAARIDHTLLKSEATAAQIDRLCDQAMQFNFWAVCVNLFHLPRAVKRLDRANSRIKTVTVGAFAALICRGA